VPRREYPGERAVVIAGLDLNGLGVLRSLAPSGFRIVALDTDTRKPTAASRYGEKLKVPALYGAGFVEALVGLRNRFTSNPVLILTQEASVATISAARDALAGLYRFTMPDHEVVEDLLDKFRFQNRAEQLAFPIPRIVRLEDASDARQALQGLRFPCVMKPATKDLEYGRQFAKAYRVNSADEALRLWDRMRVIVRTVAVQEWIEGDDSDVYFCLTYRGRDPRYSVSFAGRKLVQWPPLVGGTALCAPAGEEGREIIALTERFFEEVTFTGLGSMEYKRNRRDGRFYMVEPTVCRTDYQEEIAALNGTNIPAAACHAEFGLEPQRSRETPPRFWRDPIGCANSAKAGTSAPRALIAGRISDAYFRWNDPAPYVALKLRALRSRASRPVPSL